VKKNIGSTKDQIPDGRDRPGDAGVLAGVWIKPEQRIEAEDGLAGFRAPGQECDHRDQHDHPAEIAEAPGGIGKLADLFPTDKARHHGIVEDDREFGGDRGQDHEDHRIDDRRSGRRKPEAAEAGDLDHREEADPRLAGTGLIGDRSEDG
jgi:hypothetical protein